MSTALRKSSRRVSSLSDSYQARKAQINKALSPAERIKRAIELSELALKLNKQCSKKR